MVKRLETIPYGQVRVLFDEEGNIGLRSYETIVARIDRNGWLEIGGLYSMTTRKHIGAFMREYCNSNYQMAKYLFENNERYNLYTGEIAAIN